MQFFLSLILALVLPASAQLTGDLLTGDLRTHDPSFIVADGRYFVFSTGKASGGGQLPIRCSADAKDWHVCGQVFDKMPAWIATRSPQTRDLWAPDISLEDGLYRVYYCYSLFGKQDSGIGLAVNKTLDPASPDYSWQDRSPVLESHKGDDFNAIDPSFFRDGGNDWLVFGSFWTGIKLRELVPETGLPRDTKSYALARRTPPVTAVEAPFLFRHGDFFYLFTSWDICCRGAKSTYRIMVGRAKNITGPYLDRDGTPLQQGGGTELLTGNARWAGPGGQSVAHDPIANRDLAVFHAYDADTGQPTLQISPIDWSGGWPRIAFPSAP